jgi:hypothetical protein
MGSGRYAAKLTDEAWEEFNNYQRAHYNYIEGISSALTLLVCISKKINNFYDNVVLFSSQVDYSIQELQQPLEQLILLEDNFMLMDIRQKARRTSLVKK